MVQEIERKFLVDAQAWNSAEKPAGAVFRQGYLVTDPQKTIRVRLTPDKAFLTIKGLTTGATRPEFEYEIPVTEATELLDRFAVTELSKTRYTLPFAGKIWEVDVFSGTNTGLIVAEIELDSEDEVFALPGWVTLEVTGDARYYNANLALHPYTLWSQDLSS